MTNDQAQSLRNWAVRVGGFIWAFSALMGLGLFRQEYFHWLTTGQWDAYPASDVLMSAGLDPGQLTWIGLRQIAIWMGNLPLFLWLIFAPAILFSVISFFVEEFIERIRSATTEGFDIG